MPSVTPAAISSGAVTQFAVLDALLDGVYSSGMSASEVRTHGDTGVGCCERLGGEVVIVDGRLFECTLDAPPREMSDDESLPFVDVCTLGEPVPTSLGSLDLGGLTAAVESRLVSRNLFHAVRIDGLVHQVRTRVTPRQRPPFPPLAEVAARQVETVTRQRRGTLVGFWSPKIYQGISVAGLHLHFLSDDRDVGGHVLDVELAEGELRIEAYSRFSLQLPTDGDFLRTELTHDGDRRIVAVEGGAPL